MVTSISYVVPWRCCEVTIGDQGDADGQEALVRGGDAILRTGAEHRCLLVVQCCIALIIMQADPHLDSWMDSADVAWYCFITAATVGYGETWTRTRRSLRRRR